MKYVISLAFCAGMHPASAQLGSSVDLRHAIPNGPYPVYIVMQGVHASNITAFAEMVNTSTSIFDGHGGRIRPFGVEGNVGFVINEDNFLSIHGLSVHSVSIEGGFKFLTRTYTDWKGNDLNLQQGLLSARIGFRWNFFYPITAHIQAGPVFFHSARLNSKTAEQKKDYVADGSFGMHGMDMRGRIMFFDPVGSTGGLGFFVEGQFVYSIEGPDEKKLRTLFKGELDHVDRGDFTMGVLSIGVSIPLALRVR